MELGIVQGMLLLEGRERRAKARRERLELAATLRTRLGDGALAVSVTADEARQLIEELHREERVPLFGW